MKRKGKRGAASDPESGAAADDVHVEQPAAAWKPLKAAPRPLPPTPAAMTQAS